MNRLFFLLAAFLPTLPSAMAQKPVARFTFSEGHHEAPAQIQFTNTSEKAETYAWTFGDGGESTEANPVHRYAHAGTYTVTLTATSGKKSNTMTQNIHIDPPAKCLVEITTDYGVMVAELYDATPKHRDNFLKLAEEGYFNDLLFHRVIEGFMIQGGDPLGKGIGDPGYRFEDEFQSGKTFDRVGLLAMANSGPNTNGSQFFVTTSTPQWLNGKHTIFGEVVKGYEVVDAIQKVPKGPMDRPIQPVTIEKIEMSEQAP
jgi:cyclophilin family peptidyl-prolyl cis-trans isomerase